MKKIYSVIFAAALSCNCAFANAVGGLDAGELNRQMMRDLRMHEALTRTQNREAIIRKESQSLQKRTSAMQQTEENTKSGIQGTVMPANLQKVSFSGNVAISEKKLQKLTGYKTGQPLTNETISAVRKTVMAYYQGQGFYSAVAVPDLSNIEKGELILKIKEGPRNSIEIEQ